jgi:hypothetical protein
MKIIMDPGPVQSAGGKYAVTAGLDHSSHHQTFVVMLEMEKPLQRCHMPAVEEKTGKQEYD